jgi:hypothetical protein
VTTTVDTTTTTTTASPLGMPPRLARSSSSLGRDLILIFQNESVSRPCLTGVDSSPFWVKHRDDDSKGIEPGEEKERKGAVDRSYISISFFDSHLRRYILASYRYSRSVAMARWLGGVMISCLFFCSPFSVEGCWLVMDRLDSDLWTGAISYAGAEKTIPWQWLH